MSDMFHEYPYTNFHELNLDWVIGKLKAFESELATVEERARKAAEEYVDGKIGEVITDFNRRLEAFKTIVNADIAQIRQDFEDYTEDQDLNFEQFKAEVNATIDSYNARIEELTTRVNALYSYVDLQNAELETRLRAYIASQVYDLKVVNFFTGLKVTVQEMFDTLAEMHVLNGLTYSQLYTDYTGKTFAMLDNYCDNYDITYSEFTMNLKDIMDAL